MLDNHDVEVITSYKSSYKSSENFVAAKQGED